MEYNSDFKHDLEWGILGEKTVADIVAGDKTEVKSERDIWVKTGNHFVEIESRNKPSGICTTQAKYWSINFYKDDKFCFNITVTVDDLKKIVLKYKKRRVRGGDNNTSWGILIPITGILENFS